MNIEIITKKEKIQNIVPGDYVVSLDVDTGTFAYNEVMNTLRPTVTYDKQVKVITADNVELVTSHFHPMMVLTKESKLQWVEAGEIEIGESLLNDHGNPSKIIKIEYGNIQEDEQFYDLSVRWDNNYLAGNGTLYVSHNSATVNFPFWHHEIEDIIVLKNNKGSEDNRVRKLDYCIHFSKLFYERVISNEKITLFSPADVPELYEAFGTPEFDKMYIDLEENRRGIRKVRISARELMMDIIKERIETGRIYLLNIDHVNDHSSFLDKISMTNLCCEITLPTKPITHIDDENGEIALCILSATNVGAIRNLDELEALSDLQVRALDELIDFQEYPVKAAENATRKRRSLGIGYIGLAHYLAKNKLKYSDPEAAKLVHELTEAFQFNLIKASVQLAREKGPCEGYSKTKYSQGILPIDTYKKDLDNVVSPEYKCDWDGLRWEMQLCGMRNSTLSAQMPSESSSVVSNATNGIEPPRSALSVKKSKQGTLKQIVPDYDKLKNFYTYAWEMKDNTGYLNITGVIQKFFDQAISVNQYYDYSKFENGELPLSVVLKDLMYAYKIGTKTFYYLNTNDGKGEVEEDKSCDSGACAI